MDSESKQERSRTRWTASLDKIFVDLVVEQIQLGNRPNNVFDKKTWSHIREQFNRQTGLNFNNNQLRKHFDVLRIRYNNLKTSVSQNNFSIEDSSTTGFDLWDSLGVQTTRPESVKIKECPIFDQLCIMFADNASDGKYAQSSHYEDLENKSNGANDVETPRSEAPSSSRSLEDNMASVENVTKAINMKLKRKRLPDTHPNVSNGKEDEIQDAMAEALSDMIAASNLKAATATANENKFSITECIKALDDLQGISETLYFNALDVFEKASFREVFISLNSNEKRLQWLQHRFSDVSFI